MPHATTVIIHNSLENYKESISKEIIIKCNIFLNTLCKRMHGRKNSISDSEYVHSTLKIENIFKAFGKMTTAILLGIHKFKFQ